MVKNEREMIQSILLLLKMDAKNLFDRIKTRKRDYLKEFSLKRSRVHFAEIFHNRYRKVEITELKFCGPEVVVALDQFYTKAEELEWYLNHTEDMLGAVEDKVDSIIKPMQKFHETLEVYLEAQLEVNQEEGQLENGESESHDTTVMTSSVNEFENQENFDSQEFQENLDLNLNQIDENEEVLKK